MELVVSQGACPCLPPTTVYRPVAVTRFSTTFLRNVVENQLEELCDAISVCCYVLWNEDGNFLGGTMSIEMAVQRGKRTRIVGLEAGGE